MLFAGYRLLKGNGKPADTTTCASEVLLGENGHHRVASLASASHQKIGLARQKVGV